MKLKFTAFIIFFLLQPTLGFCHLFPEVEDFRGEIKKVVEKSYGLNLFFNGRYKYYPKLPSGYNSIYKFDKNSNLIKETYKKWCKTLVDYSYQRDTLENRIIVKQICNYDINDSEGYTGEDGYIGEDEYILDSIGRIKQCNYWYYTAATKTKTLSMIDKNATYSGDKLTSFARYMINFKGDTFDDGLFIIKYDSLGRVVEVEERNNGTNSKVSNGTFIREKDTTNAIQKRWIYHYNNEGFVDYFKVVYLGDIYDLNKEIGSFYIYYYEYDKRGNWIKMYDVNIDNINLKSLKIKRKITYK